MQTWLPIDANVAPYLLYGANKQMFANMFNIFYKVIIDQCCVYSLLRCPQESVNAGLHKTEH